MKYDTLNNSVNQFTLKSLSSNATKLIPESTELVAFKNTHTTHQLGTNAPVIFVVSIKAVIYGDTFYIYNTSHIDFSEALELCSIEVKKLKHKFADIKGKYRKGEDFSAALTTFLIDQFSFRKLHQLKHSEILETNIIDKILGIVKRSPTPSEALLNTHSLSISNSK